MLSAHARRLATWRTHYRGLKLPDRPGGGVLILDRNPRAGDHRMWAAWFLPVLTCGSCCFAVLLIVSIFEHPSPATLGSSALALVMSLLLSSATVRALFSREQLMLDGHGLDYIWTNGLMRKSRRIPFQEIRRLTRYSVMVGGNENQPSHPEYGLAIETLGRTLCVGQSQDRVEVDQLRENVEWYLKDRYAAWVNAPECADCEVLDASGFRPEPPFDSTLSCRREWDRTEFVRRIREERPAGLRDAEPDEFDSAVFLFVSTIPPDEWRDYLRNRPRFCKEGPVWEPGDSPDERVLSKLVHVVHVLVLSAPIVARG
jgi:hypothetical protein